MTKPLEYYMNNVTGTLVLCEVMRSFGVKNIVFSSSATVLWKSDNRYQLKRIFHYRLQIHMEEQN